MFGVFRRFSWVTRPTYPDISNLQCKIFDFSSGKSQIFIFLHLKEQLLLNLLTMLEATTQVAIPPTDSSVVIDDAVATVSDAVATVSEWGDSVDPTIMMDLMKRLKVSDNVNLMRTNKKQQLATIALKRDYVEFKQANSICHWSCGDEF